jgi:hypothetical protein
MPATRAFLIVFRNPTRKSACGRDAGTEFAEAFVLTPLGSGISSACSRSASPSSPPWEHQIDPRPRNERRELLQQRERLKDQMARAIRPGALQREGDAAIVEEPEPVDGTFSAGPPSPIAPRHRPVPQVQITQGLPPVHLYVATARIYQTR